MKNYTFYDKLADHNITINAKDFWSACRQLYKDFGGFYFYNQIIYIGDEAF